VLVVSLFASAGRFLQRRRQMNALLSEERCHLEAVRYHGYQEWLTGSQQGPHFWCTRTELARLRRTRDEQRMLKTGRTYWELYDIDKSARYMRGLEKAGSVELSYAWESIPTSAMWQLHQRMTELRHAEERARDEAYVAATSVLSREEMLAEYGRALSALMQLER
jgi:hypothetical protein